MDPHERSATIGVINEHGDMVTVGKFNTDQSGYAGSESRLTLSWS
jgi:hypothetical protein